ncbi:MAG TPA: cytochrome c biogenesis protein CcsA [Longimicrobiaceae bacterium]|nr:cytochrome c biogenesis protein CcsA [Longimicrobiaceae bacterium]
MTQILHFGALGLYALAAALLGVSLARGSRTLPRLATGVLALGVAAHLADLAAYAGRWQELPLVGLGPSLSVLALLVAVGSLALATLGRTGPIGLVLVPVAAVVLAAADAVGVRPGGEEMAFRGVWFVLHVVAALLAYAGLAVAFAAGLMYLLQFRELKSKRFGAVFRFFPPLETLDHIGRGALLAGLPLLTAALLLGWAWTERFHHPLSAGNPKVVWGVLTWLVFAGALAVRAGGGRREHRAALASVLGFAVVVAAYLFLRVSTASSAGFL